MLLKAVELFDNQFTQQEGDERVTNRHCFYKGTMAKKKKKKQKLIWIFLGGFDLV